MCPLYAHQESAIQELSLQKTKKPHQQYKMALESVKSDLEMTARELQKQMTELAEIQPSDIGLFREVLCHIHHARCVHV